MNTPRKYQRMNKIHLDMFQYMSNSCHDTSYNHFCIHDMYLLIDIHHNFRNKHCIVFHLGMCRRDIQKRMILHLNRNHPYKHRIHPYLNILSNFQSIRYIYDLLLIYNIHQDMIYYILHPVNNNLDCIYYMYQHSNIVHIHLHIFHIYCQIGMFLQDKS